MSSEEKFYIVPQPKAACDFINEQIKSFDRGMSYLRDAEKLEGVDEVKEAASDAENWLGDIDFEALRTQCENIREWGQAWKDKAKELNHELLKE